MKCPKCGVWSSVLETRESTNYTTKRRRECANGHRFTTVELHSNVANNVGSKIAQYAVAMANRIAQWKKELIIVAESRGYGKTRATARKHGITPGRVRQIRRKHNA